MGELYPDRTCGEVRQSLLDLSNDLANAIRDKIYGRELVNSYEISHLNAILQEIKLRIEELKECV